jgi:hypothetical protein
VQHIRGFLFEKDRSQTETSPAPPQRPGEDVPIAMCDRSIGPQNEKRSHPPVVEDGSANLLVNHALSPVSESSSANLCLNLALSRPGNPRLKPWASRAARERGPLAPILPPPSRHQPNHQPITRPRVPRLLRRTRIGDFQHQTIHAIQMSGSRRMQCRIGSKWHKINCV